MTSSHLLSLPRELRDEIWTLVFANVVFAPFRTFNPAFSTCTAICRHSNQAHEYDNPVHLDIFKCLLTCKQICHEALPMFHKFMCLRIIKAQSLEDVRLAPATTSRSMLKSLILTAHLDDENREQWMVEMRALNTTFPRLRDLTIHYHMRPPISYDFLVDAVYLAGPLVSLPASIDFRLSFAYIENKVMFTSEELGIVWYNDALEAHEAVIWECIEDATFKERSRNSDLISMTSRLLEISQDHEQPWLESLRQRRQERGAEQGPSSS